jgi:hypothetical protein
MLTFVRKQTIAPWEHYVGNCTASSTFYAGFDQKAKEHPMTGKSPENMSQKTAIITGGSRGRD